MLVPAASVASDTVHHLSCSQETLHVPSCDVVRLQSCSLMPAICRQANELRMQRSCATGTHSVRFEHARPRMPVGRLGTRVREGERWLALEVERDLRLVAYAARHQYKPCSRTRAAHLPADPGCSGCPA